MRRFLDGAWYGLARLFVRRENRWAALILICSSYLCLTGLGNVPLWHDEPYQALGARNLIQTGEFTGWDGRNLITANNGRATDEELRLVSHPPWQMLPSALGMLVFGIYDEQGLPDEKGVRFFHAVLGLMALLVFWRLLLLDFAHRPRLRVLALALFGLMTQTILFFRMGRYVADAMFFSLCTYYFYRLYVGPTSKRKHLVLATVATLFNFFNQFFIATVVAVSLASYHLIFHRRETTARQWREVFIAGGLAAGLCLGYLLLAGIITGKEDLESGHLAYKHSYWYRSFWLWFLNFNDLMHFEWVPFGVVVVLTATTAANLGTRLWHWHKARDEDPKPRKRKNRRRKPFVFPASLDRAMWRHMVFCALVLSYSAFITVQAPTVHEFANSRYLVPAWPFTALLAAAAIDWLWRLPFGIVLAVPSMAVLLLSNLASQPLARMPLRWTMPGLIHEIHNPYINSTMEVVNYLRRNAKQDDLISVDPWQDFNVLMYYLGDKMLFCCILDENSPLPTDTVLALRPSLYKLVETPDWFVTFHDLRGNEEHYRVAYRSVIDRYPEQRPEMEYHQFKPRRARPDRKSFIYQLR